MANKNNHQTEVSVSTMRHAFLAAGIKTVAKMKQGGLPSENEINVLPLIGAAAENGSGLRKRQTWRVSKRAK